MHLYPVSMIALNGPILQGLLYMTASLHILFSTVSSHPHLKMCLKKVHIPEAADSM